VKHVTRRQIHAYGLAALLLLVVALGVALAMLGHSTMAGGPQWSGGALGGAIIAMGIVVMVAMGVGATLGAEEIARLRRDRAHRQGHPVRAARVVSTARVAEADAADRWVLEGPGQDAADRSLADEILGVRSAEYTGRRLDSPGTYDLDEDAVDALVRQQAHHRAGRRTLTHHGR